MGCCFGKKDAKPAAGSTKQPADDLDSIGRWGNTRALMMFPSSGRVGFQLKTLKSDVQVPEKQKIKEMLLRERELRLCSETQKLLTEDVSCGPKLFETLQMKVAEEFGYTTQQKQREAIELLRCAVSMFPNDQEIREIPFYVKYNRAEQGMLSVGDQCPDVTLATLEGKLVQLHSTMSDQPLVLVAGSYT
jgi:hypothetical protein